MHQLFDEHIQKATEAVKENAAQLIKEVLGSAFARKTAQDAIRKGLDNDPDVLLDFEAKFLRHFKDALANAVKTHVLDQLVDV